MRNRKHTVYLIKRDGAMKIKTYHLGVQLHRPIAQATGEIETEVYLLKAYCRDDKVWIAEFSHVDPEVRNA